MISFQEYNFIEEAADAGLAAKAEKSGVSISTLRKVYKRGVAAWNSGHRPGTTPQQWGMARVNSYITKGKGTYHGADKDLREEQIDESGGKVVWKKGSNHIEKYSDDAYALYVDGKKQKFFTSIEAAKSAIELDEAVAKDKASGLPKKYVAGLSASTAKARAAHFDKADKLSDKDPEAYKPAPGDATAKTKESKHTKKYRDMFGEDMDEEIYEACWDSHKQVGMKKKGDKMVPDCVPKTEEAKTPQEKFKAGLKKSGYDPDAGAKRLTDLIAKQKAERAEHEKKYGHLYGEDVDLDDQFDLIEKFVMDLAEKHNIDPETLWEKFESLDDAELYEAAVDAKGHKSSTGGLTQKGVDAYNRKTGGNLKMAVTTPPSKLKAGSKAANRRKSFCARMSGVEGPMKDEKGRPTRKALALRKWNC